MNIVSLENVSKNYGFKPLFENVTLGLEDRDKIGIIGANGSGKTTLLRIIAGVEVPDTGRVVRAKGQTLAYLSQNPAYDENATVLETIFASSSGVMQTIRDYEAVCHDLADGKNDAATARTNVRSAARTRDERRLGDRDQRPRRADKARHHRHAPPRWARSQAASENGSPSPTS